MAQSKKVKKIFNMAYGIGASVVILGALFKLLHWEIMGIGGGALLAIGLITEAIIFFISAFEPVEEGYDWAAVFPELVGGESRGLLSKASDHEQALKDSLSEKLDAILKQANLDVDLMKSLGNSIESFAGAAKGIAPMAQSVDATQKYANELSAAATQLEALNTAYKEQLERSKNQMVAQSSVVENISSLTKEMNELKENLASLNAVYGGMLSAMNKRS